MKALILILISLKLHSYPSKLEVYFFTSKEKVSLSKKMEFQFVALNTLRPDCQRMGEYCFDPQIGLYKEGNLDQVIKVDTTSGKKQVKEFGSSGIFNQQLIKCDKNKFYDVFCGKKEKVKIKKKTFEIWMDTSRIMKSKDWDPLTKDCNRKNFLMLLKNSCSANKTYKLFGLSRVIKPLGKVGQSCQNNASVIEIDKLISWIENSNTKNLQIFLDEYYAKGKLLSFLKTRSNTKVYGIEKSIHLVKMDKQIIKLKKYCR